LDMRSTDLRLDSLAYGATSTVSDMIRTAQELMRPTLVHAETLHSARSVQFPGLDGVLPGFGRQTPNDWGLGFEIRGHKSPHWTGSANAPSTFGHFGAAGTFIWVDPNLDHALVVLTDEPFGPWARHRWPELNDAVVSALS